MSSSSMREDKSVERFEELLENESDIKKVEMFSVLDERMENDLIEDLVKSKIIPPVTKKEIEQSTVKGVQKFVDKYGLLVSSIEKYQWTQEYDTFKHNCDNLRKLDNITSLSYELFEIVSRDSPDILESILQVDEENIESYLDDMIRCRPLFNEQLLIQVVQVLEVYIFDILKFIYNKEIKKLILDDDKKGGKTLKYKDILDCNDVKDIYELMIEEEIRETQSWDRIIQVFNDKKKLNIKFEESGFTIENLKKLIQTRHLIIHRKGIVDRKYLEKTEDRSHKVGDKIEVSYKMFTDSLKNVSKLVELIDNKVVDRYY